ncbi:peptidoglycan-binding domain-containing protein [Georgenia sp. MJ173]|uniref:peptidoglycan-binding domain-containing protein n=1 Tax=Georgenia sunbinii TaxID=3117728 RepID=UPI002F263183
MWAVPVVAVVIAFPLAGANEERSVAPPQPTVVEVGSRVADARTAVEVVVVYAEAATVQSPVSGIVSSLPAPGPVELGEELYAVDGVPVLVYRGPPLWRDLEVGDRGEDVDALGRYLAALDLMDEGQVDDRYGTATRKAVRSLQDRLGVPEDGRFRLSYVARVEDGMREVTEYLVGLGGRVELDMPVARGEQPAETLTMDSISANGSLQALAQQPVALHLGSSAVPLSSTAPSDHELPTLAAALEDGAAAGSLERVADEGAGVTRYRGAILALQEPLPRGIVPSTAVQVDDDGTTCVLLSDGANDDVEPRRLDVVQPSNEVATVFVDADLVGQEVLRDVAQAPSGTRCG